MANNAQSSKAALKFHKKLYKEAAIKQAVKAFSHLADFKVVDRGHYTMVNLDNIKREVTDIIADEFGNYVLALLKNK